MHSKLCILAALLAATLFVLPARAFVDKSAMLPVSVLGGRTASPLIQESWGHGCSFVDLDGDGVLELYVVMANAQPNYLFQYQPAGPQFIDIASGSSCADTRDGRGVVWADYDNDGDPDVFVSTWNAGNRLYQNGGSGNFTDVTAAAGMSYTGRCESAAWADYNNDGWLDLFVCNYGRQNETYPNRLYVSDGDGTFTEVAAAAGVDDPNKPALACAWIDYDNDHDLDLYIAYDKDRGNTLFRNNGNGTFTDVTSDTHLKADMNDLIVVDQFLGTRSLPMNGMGIAIADYDNNGYLDLFITNVPPGSSLPIASGHALLRNNGNGTFNEVGAQLGVRANAWGWGAAFFDYDNDGNDDLYITHGQFVPGEFSINAFFRNNGGTFSADMAGALGIDDDGNGFGMCVGDYNNDGFIDIFVHNQENVANTTSKLYENVPNSNHWIKIRPVGTTSNRDGIGAVIRVTTGTKTQVKDVRSGSSYLSNNSRDVHFGLANSSIVNQIQVTWPSGIVDTWNNVPVNKFLIANEASTLELLPVFITTFEGESRSDGIALSWAIRSDEGIRGYRLYRKGASDGREIALNDALIGPAVTNYLDGRVEPGARYAYTLVVVEADGGETRSQSIEVAARSWGLSLGQNFPNPFNPTTQIAFTLPQQEHVFLSVYDAGGRLVKTLVSETLGPGAHNAAWNGTNAAGEPVASGIYFYRLRAGKASLTRKMILLK